MRLILAILVLLWPGATYAQADPHARITAAADAAFRLWVEEQPLLSLKYGPVATRLYDPSPGARAVAAKAAAATRATLAGIDKAALPLEDALLLDRTRWMLARTQMLADVARYSFPIDGTSHPLLGAGTLLTTYPLETADQRAGYLALLGDAVRLVAAMKPQLERQANDGIAVPAICLAASAQTWRNYAFDDLLPAGDRLKKIPSSELAPFLRAVGQIVAKELAPAIGLYINFAEGPFAKRASPRLGLAQYRGGRAAYQRMMASELTSDVTPEAVNAIGLRDGIALREELARLRAQIGYRGPAQGFDGFLRKTRPDLIATSRAELGRRMTAQLARIGPRMKDWFALAPFSPLIPRSMPEALEASTTYGWMESTPEIGGPGYFYYNGAPGRLLTGTAPLAWHEGFPGHHFQYLVATHPTVQLHPLQRETWASFFSEGWAVYATELAGEMGMNADAMDKIDSVQDAAFMTSRLAIDTGLNALGWSYARAHEYMAVNTGAPEAEIASELRRYGCESPAQALGYQYGSLAIGAARKRAEHALGSRFDIRAFHTAIMTRGEISAAALDRIVDAFVAAK